MLTKALTACSTKTEHLLRKMKQHEPLARDRHGGTISDTMPSDRIRKLNSCGWRLILHCSALVPDSVPLTDISLAKLVLPIGCMVTQAREATRHYCSKIQHNPDTTQAAEFNTTSITEQKRGDYYELHSRVSVDPTSFGCLCNTWSRAK